MKYMRVTVENCREMLLKEKKELGGDIEGQAAAWNVVCRWCNENGEVTNKYSGIENIIDFLTKLTQQQTEPA